MPIFRLSAGGLGYFADIPGCGGGATIRSLEVRFGPLAFYDPLHTETPPAAGRGPRLSMLAGRRCSGCFRPASSRRPSPWCAIRSTGCGRSTCSSGRSRARSRRRRASASGSRTSPSGRSMSPPSSTMPADGRPRAQGRRESSARRTVPAWWRPGSTGCCRSGRRRRSWSFRPRRQRSSLRPPMSIALRNSMPRDYARFGYGVAAERNRAGFLGRP